MERGGKPRHSAQRSHGDTWLPTGRVLVAGGAALDVLSSAEVYDPVSGAWSATGSLSTAYFLHTATLLPNGKVLVAGGENDGGILSSVDVYDSASGTWSSASSLSAARWHHTATLLLSGKVLLAGGDNNTSGILNSAELNDDGLGYETAWQPVITAATSPLNLGNALTLGGAQFTGYQHESASGGSTNDSASNIPVVQLQSLGNEQQLTLLSDPAHP